MDKNPLFDGDASDGDSSSSNSSIGDLSFTETVIQPPPVMRTSSR
jgi:hypothetical protein